MSAQVVEELRERISALEGGPARVPIPTHPLLVGLLQLHAGGTYVVDSASLALTLAAGASRAGEWVGFAGWQEFGAEAATQWGVALDRTVLVPHPGEHWLEVTAALVDVLTVVVLRPAGTVDPKSASVLQARLRARSAALVVWGDWPRPDARITTRQVRWQGLERGHGRLRERQVRVDVRRGGPPLSGELVYPS
ncbi:hypothetical protein KUV85_05440 [Nocardioides panacisoli]|uniref:hypothetical protein n=1 Tax=Nocardioides panacisoli TaxID=627624 RepID=UPI001C6304B9|nr:hypothetical protein [Nocardioides panacisoli]QYJ05131.1 hypothetical protein KUV85_05440 [Nocardioides panacisoli]